MQGTGPRDLAATVKEEATGKSPIQAKVLQPARAKVLPPVHSKSTCGTATSSDDESVVAQPGAKRKSVLAALKQRTKVWPPLYQPATPLF